MKFAINYSPQAAELLSNGQIEIDAFKTPPWPDLITKAKALCPVTVHFPFRTGEGKNIKTKIGEIENFLDSTTTNFINVHLVVKASKMPHIPVYETPSPMHKVQIIDTMLSDLQDITSHFGPENTIAENYPYHIGENSTLRGAIEPDIISEVIVRADCGLLLDVSHARIAAHYIGMDPIEYIHRLPLDRLKELHFAGIHDWDGYLQDHLPMLEEDWEWLIWVLNKVKAGEWGQAHMLAFEYGGIRNFYSDHSDIDKIKEQAPRFYSLCHKG
jgi:uncharacterized protein (UPF0276 family)